jgi:hypothetical protein
MVVLAFHILVEIFLDRSGVLLLVAMQIVATGLTSTVRFFHQAKP